MADESTDIPWAMTLLKMARTVAEDLFHEVYETSLGVGFLVQIKVGR